jgi:hypothetical protein
MIHNTLLLFSMLRWEYSVLWQTSKIRCNFYAGGSDCGHVLSGNLESRDKNASDASSMDLWL